MSVTKDEAAYLLGFVKSRINKAEHVDFRARESLLHFKKDGQLCLEVEVNGKPCFLAVVSDDGTLPA